MQPFQPDHPPRSSATELDKERNRAAAERSLMAWIQTSLSLISFGFGIDQIVKALNQAVDVNNPMQLSQFLGLSFIICRNLFYTRRGCTVSAGNSRFKEATLYVCS